MAVELDIELQASDVIGEIGAIAKALKGLEMTADDTEIDFDVDVKNIRQEINKLRDALDGIDTDLSRLSNDLERAAEAWNNAEATISTPTPDGNTGSGDSTGGDPPVQIESGFEKVARKVADGDDSGLGRNDTLKRLFGRPGGVAMGLGDMGDLHKLRSSLSSNLGQHDGDFGRKSLAEMIGARSRFGMEPISRIRQRRVSGLDFEGDDGASAVDLVTDSSSKDNRPFRHLPKDVFREATDSVDDFGNANTRLKKKLKSLRPTMGKYMQLLAAIIPLAITLGVQLLGVAAALGSIAVAGAGVIGLGLLGHGENMAESFAEAKKQVRDLKKDLFETFQPSMQQLAPLQAQLFDQAPDMLQPVNEALEGLGVHEDTLMELGHALAGGFAEAINIINSNAEAINTLVLDIGGMIGSGLLELFEWLIQNAAANKQFIRELGSQFVKLGVIIFNLSTAISRVVVGLGPLLDVLVLVSKILNNDIVAGLLTTIGYLFTLAKMTMLVKSLGASIKALTVWMSGYTATTWGAVAATLALASALSLGLAGVAGGAGIIGSGIPGGNPTSSAPTGSGVGPGGSAGGGMVVNDNRSYTINSGGEQDYASQKRLEEEIDRSHEDRQAQSEPTVETSSVESTMGI